jgi:hypothetical protein
MLNARLVDEAVNKSGGEKKRLQRMVLNGQVDQLTATLAAMRIDRIQNAAKLDQLNQPTVAEQVMNPQPQMPPQGGMPPQMPPQGMGAMPQAQQMPQQMPQQAQMGRPQMPPQGMAMGGGLDAIPYNEGDYAEGGIVGFNMAGSVYAQTMSQLRNQLANTRIQAERDKITSQMNQLRAQYEQPSIEPKSQNIDAFVRENIGQPIRQGINAGIEAIGNLFSSGDASDPLDVSAESFTDGQRATEQTAPMRSTDLSTAAQQNLIAGFTPEQKSIRAGLGELAAPETLAMLGERKGTGANETFVSPERIRAARVRGAPDLLDEGDLRDSIPRVQEAPGEKERGGPEATIEDTGISAQVNQTQETANVLGGKTDTTVGGAPVNMDKPVEETGKVKSVEDYFKELSGLRDEEPGPYTQELRNELANRAETMSAAKKDAYSMALLQTGLGVLSQDGQPGGALQALGKSALPAVKEATAAIKAAKKEDRELLKMGASIEQAEGRRKDALLNAAVKQHGSDKTAAATIKAAEVNANRETDFDRKINGLVGGYKAADKAMGVEIQSDEIYEAKAIRYVEEQAVKRAQVAAGASIGKTVTSETEDWRGRREKFIAELEGIDGLTAKAQWADAFKKSEGRTPTSAEWEQEKQRRIDGWNQRNPQPGVAPQPEEGQQSAIASGAGTQASPFVVTQRVPVSQMVVGKYYTFPNGVTATYIGNGKFKPIK